MHNKVSTSANFIETEMKILEFWKEYEVFENSISNKKDAPSFTFYDGPPTANGKPHVGHIITRIVKDIIPRYKTMKGYKVLRKAGWDTHGLPVELEVEKKLGINGKPDIEEYGISEFINECKESVWPYESLWRQMSERVGYWIDMDNPYVTYDNKYIESIWWALKTIWDKNLIYKGYRIVPYCSRCGTSLSSHEVAQSYKDVKDKSVYVKFKVADSENQYFLAWTTTPWTLPSNVALTVNPKEHYSYVKYKDEVFILANSLLNEVLKEDYEIIKTVTGKELENIKYERLFNFAEVKNECFYVCCDEYVTLTAGTGIVHTSPAFGEEDARVGKDYGLDFLQLVNEQGKFVKSVTPWEGIFVKDADPLIIKELEVKGNLFKSHEHEHSYPFCWRCDTPLLYYARNAWFIKMSSLRKNLVKNNETVNWYPETIKTGRFGNFLENVIDWSLSRERYWGTPLPIWECECEYTHIVGSIEELEKMSGVDCSNLDLHKPFIDEILLDCPKCKSKMKRVPEVIDCWFDSGSMPFAQWHYPFENKELFESQFPADFISEAIDQTRGWFYTLMAISTLLFDKSPYRNVIVLGHVQDKNGLKMSKSKGNVVDPNGVLMSQGADAVRWYFINNSAPWSNSRFHEDLVKESGHKFLSTLTNTYAFYVLYANIDNFNSNLYQLNHSVLSTMDKWIISKLNSLIKLVDNNLEAYKLTEATRAIDSFIEELSNWYIRRSRKRFWANGITQDKINAYTTLYHVLTTLSKVLAPFTPFIAEEIYQNLVYKLDSNAPISVHLCAFPKSEESLIDESLEEKMNLVLNIVFCGRSARNDANIKNRQPLQNIFIKTTKDILDDTFKEIISDELNIKEITITNNLDKFISYKFKPQLKILGPKYGKDLPKISNALLRVDPQNFYNELNTGKGKLNIDDKEILLTIEEVLIEAIQKEGYNVESNSNVAIVIDTNLTEELIEEGFTREIVSKIQTMRKEGGFEILDKILITYIGNEKIKKIITNNIDSIKNDVLAVDIVEQTPKGYMRDWDINGENLSLGIIVE